MTSFGVCWLLVLVLVLRGSYWRVDGGGLV
jgi:hypothetical protein